MHSLESTGKIDKPRLECAEGAVYFPMCTHTVPATVVLNGRSVRVVPGQRCPRCSGSLDGGFVMDAIRAA